MIDPTIQEKYIMMLSSSLEGFKVSRNHVYNFRCPLCGDSKTNISKRRGYLLQKDGEYLFYCHNCNTSMYFKKFLHEVNPSLYADYQKDIVKNGWISFSKPEKIITAPVWELKKHTGVISVSELPDTHPSKIYLRSRLVPEYALKYVKWTDDFPKLIKDSIGEKYADTKLPDCGIVFELKELDKKITGYQIRSIEENCPKNLRFVTCSMNGEHGYFYKELDTSKPIYIVEGCIDSLFIENCIAVLSSSLYRIDTFDNCTYINDQEPRNKEVCKQIRRCVDRGLKTVLLPHDYDGMDINDLVKKAGIKIDELIPLFEKYTYSGVTAKLKFANWCKV